MKRLRIFILALIAVSYLSVGSLTKTSEGQTMEVIHYLPSCPTDEQRDAAIRELQLIVASHEGILTEAEEDNCQRYQSRKSYFTYK